MVFSEEQFYFYMTTNTYKVLYTGFTVDLKRRIKEHKDKVYKKSFTDIYNIDKLIYFIRLKQSLKQEKENDK